ncbi:trypsin domain-containing protein [Ditylenchus destructor]|uniref:Trypsin domain-containing protein n=1 Tax=Ditylenchus destructor TaxID=166010 RepID=A0AAD4ML80_9BILA|nr:trypsin domain-containing protein [Ditylenchus destructor]
MRRLLKQFKSARLNDKQTNSENEAQETKVKKSQSNDKIPNIAAMDNGTMVEAFKFLNYYQLATNSLVSKRYWNLIRTHRHKLALLDVDEIYMNLFKNQVPAFVRIFNEELSSEEYNKWIVRHGYSKQVPVDDSNHCHDISATVFIAAKVELKNKTWPLFQHFIRLLMDPFIYIRTLILNPQKHIFTLLAGAMNPDRDRLQCKRLNVDFNADTQKFIVWIKDHVRCDECEIYVDSDSNYDEELLDLFLTGAPCTSAINIINYDLSKVIVDLVQKFMGLANRNEYQVVESIRGDVDDRRVAEEFKCNEFIAEEEQYEESDSRQVIGFMNKDIGKKLTLLKSGKRTSITLTMSNWFLTLGLTFAVISLVSAVPVEDNDKCGVSDFPDDNIGERIINGAKVPQGKYPWLAFMPHPGCTATIVSRNYILTAGHCVCVTYPPPSTPQPCDPIDVSMLTVVVGSVNKTKGQELKVKNAIHHKKFVFPSPKDEGVLHDIGLLELEEPLNFTKNIRRVCLSGKHQEGDPKKKVVITGWGDITGQDTRPIVLREGTARVADDKTCQKTYSDYDAYMICIASRNNTKAFHGDSGGPAMVRENGRWSEVENFKLRRNEVDFDIPIIYARVSSFCNWIAKKTNNEVKCDS